MLTRKILVVIFTTLMLCGLVPVTANAATPVQLDVVAMGDSYASGTGAGNYHPGTEGVCWRSHNSYSELAVQDLQSHGAQVNFFNVTCSGATIDDLRQVFKGQPPQLSALTPSTDVVYLTIGGNDIGFGAYASICLSSDCTGTPTANVINRLPVMGENLRRLMDEIKARSPHARVVLVGYGRPVTPGANAVNPPPADSICGAQVLTQQERFSAAIVSSGLDVTLRFVADAKKAAYVSPFVNSVQLHSSFKGHSLCEAGMPFYRGFDALVPGQEGPDAVLHLNQLGHAALYQLTRSAVDLAG
jgi:lysophospholipase L1-like esterase